jgi:ABC-type multidrug transport system fused ATPase/permease subunit
MTIQQIIKDYKYSIFIVFSCILLENIAWIVEPTFFGKLLDAMIDHFYDHKNNIDIYFPLLIWIIIYLVNVFGGTMSRLSGGRVYSRMYAEVACRVISNARKQGHPAGVVMAHAELAKDYTNFLKERLPEVTWQLSAIFGAIIAMFFYDWRIAVVCLLVIIPMFLINNLYRINVVKLQKEINDTRENLFSVFEGKEMHRIHEYYFSMVRPQRKIAQWNAWDYGIIKTILMVIFIVVLFICVDVDNFSTGKIYSVVAYLWTFISSIEYLPTLMESTVAVKELSSRLKVEPEI